MHVFNQNVPVEFYQEFVRLVRDSTLHSKAGTITLFVDWETMEAHAALTPPGSNAPNPLGHGRTPYALFVQILATMEPPPIASAVPASMTHPGPGRWWWLSFCDTERPEGQQFRGVAVVEGRTLREALDAAQALGINPGGRVASVACTLYVPGPAWRSRLLSREEVIEAGNSMERQSPD